ncbi:signal transduction histidine kinase [Rubidibacter lacunae KORDI 51-2]|uniref:histidine kinase n=1 Tax=Rubidibacter lacunae KORDI 51-2 TaxID=582515 RepID=U5DQN8_9CHRO|nr:PAS domain-containing sensor histidine kinase [Rubidibacter lacunae]ERN42939.1 signal transduction histidine kinase [Rubidibacter lacunae KORDI 51-2]
MVKAIAFLLGLALGLAVSFYQSRRRDRQLQQVLDGWPQGSTDGRTVSLLPRLRRDLARSHHHHHVLEKAIATWHQAVDGAPVGYLQVDEDNQLHWCNQQARHLLQIERWQPGQVRLLLEVVRSYELDRLIEKTRHTQQLQTCEWQFRNTDTNVQHWQSAARASGSDRTLALRATASALPAGAVGVFLENQQPLVELRRSRERAFADLTHELRTPLTSIRLVAETLQGRLRPPEKTWVEQLLLEANRLIHLVEDWLEVTQLDRQLDRQLQLETVVLQDLVCSAWETLAPLACQKSLQLVYEESQPLTLQADRARLLQVFLNLFDNAIKFSPYAETVRVHAQLADSTSEASNEQLIVDTIDAGTGFSESDLKHACERRYRGTNAPIPTAISASDSLASARPGSGLGLAIAQQIVRAHGGTIRVQNHPETGGGWLRLELPQVTLLPRLP